MNIKLMPPQTKIQKIAYATLLPCYYPDILIDYEKVNFGLAQTIWETLCTEINHLENSYLTWLKLNKTEQAWFSHLNSCGYKIPDF